MMHPSFERGQKIKWKNATCALTGGSREKDPYVLKPAP
jgi:hypothetical protein